MTRSLDRVGKGAPRSSVCRSCWSVVGLRDKFRINFAGTVPRRPQIEGAILATMFTARKHRFVSSSDSQHHRELSFLPLHHISNHAYDTSHGQEGLYGL